jgi:hypothetical protein
MDLQLADDFKEFLRLLNSEKIEYLLVGGYAVGVHGYSRMTGDLDVWVAVHPTNAHRLVTALVRFGFGEAGLRPDLFLKPKSVIRMGHPPLKIEIITSAAGVEFADCYPRRSEVLIDGVPVHVIGRQDLLTNKRAAGRPKDLNDVQALEQGNKK